MSRRRGDDAPSMESDSFLDIVANIVGILIILIMVVGVRVGQSAAVAEAERVAAAAPTKPHRPPVVAPRPILVASEAPAEAPSTGPSPALLAAIDDAAVEAESLRSEAAAVVAALGRLDGESAALAAGYETLAVEGREADADAAAAEQAGRGLSVELDALRAELNGVNRQLTDMPAENVAVLKHRLNPIGREVNGKELHFRLSGGRVAHIPIEEMIERLKPQIEKQKDWIAKYRRHQGTIGPVGGFTMTYVVERQRLGVVDELRYGPQVMRIVVSGWKVEPEPTLVAETADEAVRPDSRFLSAVRLAERGSTVTLWVYPDSFDLYRRLQEACHAEGVPVAARPLPAGVPIAGSPQGSRSSSQ